MGAFATRIFFRRLVSPTAMAFGAAFFAFAIAVPTIAEARFSGQQLVVSEDCNVQPKALRASGPCRVQTLAKAPSPERIPISGKLGLVLADNIYCRTSSLDVSEFRRKGTACLPCPLPPQRLIGTGDVAVDWPAGRVDPAPHAAMTDVLTLVRLPDG